MTSVEIAALDENFRPQGLLTPDDCYAFKLASRRYRGAYAPEIEFFGTAVSGYGDGCPKLELARVVGKMHASVTSIWMRNQKRAQIFLKKIGAVGGMA